jgi:translation elongation factor EF-G
LFLLLLFLISPHSYVAKLTPGDSGFWAFGRVLSGTVTRNQRVHCVGPAFEAALGAHQADTFENVSVQSLALPRGAEFAPVETVEAGSLVLLGGIDKYLNRTGTVVAATQPLASVHPVRGMKYTVSAVVCTVCFSFFLFLICHLGGGVGASEEGVRPGGVFQGAAEAGQDGQLGADHV